MSGDPQAVNAALTPVMRQYLEIKGLHPDAILFYRLGDFYEMFYEDAETASKILEITLTSRNKDSGQPVPMCGVPHHAAGFYINKLVRAGRKVAICEQVEEPGPTKKLLKREVVWVAAPGLTVDSESLEATLNNYLAAVIPSEEDDGQETHGLAFLDLSTGEFRCTEVSSGGLDATVAELVRVSPAHVLLPAGEGWRLREALASHFFRQPFLEELNAEAFDQAAAGLLVSGRLASGGFSPAMLEGLPLASRACGAILHYLRQVGGAQAEHVREITLYSLADYMLLDETTERNLELFETVFERSRRGSVIDAIDHTVTAMGGRMLRDWMKYPLLSVAAIEARQNAVAELLEDVLARERVRQVLDDVADLERLVARVAMRRALPRDLCALKDSLRLIPEIKRPLQGNMSLRLTELAGGLDECAEVRELIERAVVDDPPLALREGGFIRAGYNSELDDLVAVSNDAKGWIARLEVSERARAGISSLKVGYNKIFGYYIEVSRTNLPKVPSDYIRKQTVVNGERFVTEGLKQQEAKVVSAEQMRARLELELFSRLSTEVAKASDRLKRTAHLLAQLDVLAGLAQAAADHSYCRPKVSLSDRIDIKGGRHPVVERVLKERFTPNDLVLDDSGAQQVIITGPNMAGKSTLLRQTGLIVLLAQTGSFVPADSAEIGLTDRIFTRVGAMDSLSRGQSTFMVEMTETASILANLTDRSLVLLDEIGRGTSTFDGLAIAWAVAEYLNGWRGKGVKTLFATHYHELTRMAEKKPRVRNANVAAREAGGTLHFIHKLLPGAASRSYGVQVARLAGLPRAVTDRAAELLAAIEAGELEKAADSAAAVTGERQLGLFRSRTDLILERLREVDPLRLTPLDALNLLHELKRELGQDQ
ncbi:MAG: DNA mismatch repair protein MutS [Pseudomonadota bacterium]